MKKVIVVGGGWAGCAAALAAKKQGADVELFEKNDLLLGTGLVGGIYKNNGRYTATEEMINLGAGELFLLLDHKCLQHENVNFPGHQHASLYNVFLAEKAVKEYLTEKGVKIRLNSRVTEIITKGKFIKALLCNGKTFEGEVFIDTTGTAGPQKNCIKYGNGCAMCIIRCPSFGGRVSITTKAGGEEIVEENHSFQAVSGSCKIEKRSLSLQIKNILEQKGVFIYPLPRNKTKTFLLFQKACQQYAIKEFAENIIFLDTGQAKMMSPFIPLDFLHSLPGLELARYVDPYAGSKGNSIRFNLITVCEPTLKVVGVENLFCAGEKIGLAVGHTEAIVSGSLAGFNSVRFLNDQELITLPEQLCIGDYLKYIIQNVHEKSKRDKKFTFSGSVYFERMKKLGLYTTNCQEIKEKVTKLNFLNLFSMK